MLVQQSTIATVLVEPQDRGGMMQNDIRNTRYIDLHSILWSSYTIDLFIGCNDILHILFVI